MRLLMRMSDRTQGPAPVQAHRLQRRETCMSAREADHVHTKSRRAQEMLATSLGSITGSRDHDGASPGEARTITRRGGVGKGFRRSPPAESSSLRAGGQAEPSCPRGLDVDAADQSVVTRTGVPTEHPSWLMRWR